MSKNKQSIKIDADAQGFIKEIEKSTTSVTSLKKELKLNQQQLKENENNVDLLTTRVETLNKQYDEQTKIVENTNKVYEKSVELFGENSEEAQKWKNKLIEAKTKQQEIKNVLDDTNKKLAEQSDNLIQTGQKWQEQGEKITKAGEKIEKIGSKLSVVSAGVVALAGGSLKASIDFESAFTGVEKTVDGTTEQLANLKKGILDMSTELPSSAVEISAVAESAGQLGIQTDNVLSFTKTMIDMGNSTNLSSDEAATSLARFANITQMSQKDFDRLGSSIVDLGNNFATTESEIVDMALRLAGAGHQVGMSEGQILGLATALSSVGIEAEMGGSALSKAMVKMQNAVEMGGKKLDTVLNKTGMSLRELELMSANDSMGFKGLADEIGMTSTELKQLITAGTNLEDFASISGMTAEQFKKAWKEDATGALTAFIKGLGTAEDKGESAIVLLSEMGLSEVRLRDSLLRAANAGDLFNSAIDTGTKAWKDNTALTNEANKRYGTTESQIKTLKNEVVKLGIEFGNELAPSLRTLLEDAKPLLTNIASAVKQFSKLDTTTKQNVIRAGALVVALGPVVKTLGSVTSAVGKATTSIGKVTNAIGVIKTGTKSANDDVNKLAGTFTKMSGTAGVATAGIGAFLLVVGAAATYCMNATQATRELKKSTDESLNSYNECTSAIDNNMQAKLNEIDRCQILKQELEKIVDENGKIKEGYEARAKVITGELSESLGTEISITGNVIDKYKDLQGEIDKLILKKKGEIILSANEEKYANAIKNRTQKTQELLDTQEKLNKEQENLNELTKNLEELQEKLTKPHNLNEEDLIKSQIKYYEAQIDLSKINLENVSEAYNNTKKEVEGYTKDINNYNYASELVAENTTESLTKLIDSTGRTYQKNGETVSTTYKEMIQEQQTYLSISEKLQKEAVEANNTAEAEKTNKQTEEIKTRIANLISELQSHTSLVEENSPDIVEAWKCLATDSYDTYAEKLANMPPEMRKKIQELTGVIVYGTPEAEMVTRDLATKITDSMENSTEAQKSALETLQGYLKGLSDEEQRELLKNAGIEDVDGVMKGLKEGNLSEEQGKSVLKGILDGLNNKDWNTQLKNKASSIANSISKLLDIKATVGLSSGATSALSVATGAGHADGIAYVPYNNYVARLHEGERVLTKKENAEYIRNNISNKNNRNVTVNIYPQQMTEGEMYKISRFVNREWGRKK